MDIDALKDNIDQLVKAVTASAGANAVKLKAHNEILNHPFKFNPDAHYPVSPTVRNSAQPIYQSSLHVVVKDGGEGFDARLPDSHFQGYALPKVTNVEVVNRWKTGDKMSFYQNQVNFAVWCATSGCGVSEHDHLEAKNPLLKAVYRFHMYYTVRRILNELKVLLPGDTHHNPLNSPYDHRAYERLANEFVVDLHSDWRFQKEFGIVHLNSIRKDWKKNVAHMAGREAHVEKWTAADFDSGTMTFDKEIEHGHTSWGSIIYETPKLHHVDYVAQDDAWKRAWTWFILQYSYGFTRAGVELLNDSIRVYVWAILNAQGKARTSIIGGAGLAFDAQKQFLALVEHAIGMPVDIGAAIQRYQDVLGNARSEVNFSFGQGLYMAPSDMELQVGQIAGYNNEIVIAGPDEVLGQNTGLNKPSPPAQPQPQPQPENPVSQGPLSPVEVRQKVDEGLDLDSHEDQRRALVIGGIAIGLVVLWLLD